MLTLVRFCCLSIFTLMCFSAQAALFAQEDLIVVAAGDSITVGYSNDVGNGRPTRFQDSFDLIGAEGITVVPVAKGGINAQGFIEQGYLDQVIASNPDVVLLNLGANDSTFWLFNPNSLGWYQSHYNQILDELLAAPSAPHLIISTVLPFAPYDANLDPNRHIMAQAVTNEINPWLIQRADEIGATLVDQHTTWLNKPFYSIAYSDAVHPHPIYRDALAADYRDAVLATVSALATQAETFTLDLPAAGPQPYADGSVFTTEASIGGATFDIEYTLNAFAANETLVDAFIKTQGQGLYFGVGSGLDGRTTLHNRNQSTAATVNICQLPISQSPTLMQATVVL